MTKQDAIIWKFPFKITDEFSLDMPLGAEILHVEAQRGVPCLWARVVPTLMSVAHTFRLRGTGHLVDRDCCHVGSFFLEDGDLVFHLFEVRK